MSLDEEKVEQIKKELEEVDTLKETLGMAVTQKEVKMTIKTLLELIDERIVDLELRAGDSNFMLAFRGEARARIDELEWVKRQMEVNDD